MSDALPVAPYKILSVDGQDVPWYIVPFDKDGQCTGPKTLQHLLSAVQNGAFTDIFIFSHGWNNDWKSASTRYDEFIAGYTKLRLENGLTYASAHRPLLVGVFWPSTALVAPWESAPKFASSGDGATVADHDRNQDAAVAQFQTDLQELAELVDPPRRPRLYELLQREDAWSADEQRELAGLLAPVWNRLQSRSDTDPAAASTAPLTPEELHAVWNASTSRATPEDEGLDPDALGGLERGGAVSDAAAASSLGDVLGAPRNLLRTFTVLQMKDRAATVGASGVGAMLRALLSATPSARVHMVGHSYGCAVVLSAICYPDAHDLPRKVDSVLLLQPAVSRFCFAERIPGSTAPGGYRVAFARVVQPILATFSTHDVALTKLFHVAARRDRDLGQAKIAAAAPSAPSKYAALGGYGPDGCAAAECAFQPMLPVGARYTLDQPSTRVIGLNADRAISGHGAISVPETWWALYNQVTTG